MASETEKRDQENGHSRMLKLLERVLGERPQLLGERLVLRISGTGHGRGDWTEVPAPVQVGKSERAIRDERNDQPIVLLDNLRRSSQVDLRLRALFRRHEEHRFDLVRDFLQEQAV